MIDSVSPKEEIADDPFAADIFAAKRKNSAEDAAREIVPAEANWARNLPKAARPEINWNALLAALPPEISDELPPKIAAALGEILNLPAENRIEFLPLVKKELIRAADFPAETASSWWLTVGVEPGETEVYFEIDNAFAVWLADATLGAEISERAAARELTMTETAVLEFLAMNLAHEANRSLRQPIFKFRALNRQFPQSLANARQNSADAAKSEARLAVNWQIVHGLLPSIIKIYLAPEVLENLQIGKNPLLAELMPSRHAKFQNSRVENLRARVACGQIELSIAELAALEKADVLLLDNYSFSIFAGNFGGRGEIFLGDDENAKIVGTLTADFGGEVKSNQPASGKILVQTLSPNQILNFMIDDLSELENVSPPEEIAAENPANEDDAPLDESAAAMLENIAVTLRVELEARRLTLSEAANLRVNQVLELGARPTDPVNLVIDNRIVGRGELVEVENRLGVRVVSLWR